MMTDVAVAEEKISHDTF